MEKDRLEPTLNPVLNKARQKYFKAHPDKRKQYRITENINYLQKNGYSVSIAKTVSEGTVKGNE